ncbi:hypothetical protein BES36_001540 [Haemophilus quentini]|uniref:DUF2827 domain-containing protein n=1 Tax=Haemophilus sp. 1595 TaxID=502960 RepID=B3FNS9_9PAST|nr:MULTISPECIES: DUF2827 family protein [Haemophilus]ACA04479.1 hypothetical protein [Haemophilus sp. 1595]EGT82624.1 Hypothetical protein GGE_0620 [Haemophilus haemolyticus M21639]NYA46807.1 DUF2827 family protein [Haemophilus haemolyticus]OEY75492.1 hypothetical protein BFQ29_02390 [Haemophilus quentini]ORC38844.1 hypothetical protein BES36_001540 [Haemophilus quentini]
MRKYKIGITFNLEGKTRDIWANGAGQNIIFLYNLLESLDCVESVVLVSDGPNKITVPDKGFMLDDFDLSFAYIYDVIDDLDVLIEGTLTIEPDYANRIHQRGGKTVVYKMGNDYIYDIESTIHNKPPIHQFNGAKIDANWIIPQHINTNLSYFSIMHSSPVREVPAIWATTFCLKAIKERPDLSFGYIRNTKRKKYRVSSFESNTIILKNSFTDILIAEQAYRERPDLIEHVYMCNTYDKREHSTFHNFIGRTDLVKDGVMSVENRFRMTDFLSIYTDIVLSTQWENGLNYAYNEALYGGYPLVHNSTLLPKGIGYYYDQFDAFDGAKKLIYAIENHDKNYDEYMQKANDYLDSLNPYNPVNLAIYERELKRLFK